MLKSLQIQNYALIQELQIDFEKNFSTLTGETGAGKSILLGALALALGNRAETNVLSNPEKKCMVEGKFLIGPYQLQAFFEANDLDYENETIIRREIAPSGKSRAFINDTPVNLTVLKELGSKLVDIHSQHESLELNNSVFQMKVLDAVAKNEALLLDYKEKYKEYMGIKEALIHLEEEARQANADYDYHLFQFNELNELNLEKINQEELEAELQVLNNTEEIKHNLSYAYQHLSGNELNITSQLKQVKQSLEQIQEFFPQAKGYADRIETSFIDLNDMAAEIETSAETMEYNPERAEEVKGILDRLYGLLQKHQTENIHQLIEVKNQLDEKLQKKESHQNQIQQLKQSLNTTQAALDKLAKELSEKRNKAIHPFGEKIMSQLAGLGIPNAAFKVAMEQSPEYTAMGKDKVSFLFSANKNQSPQNISKIASGGEISRLMLSIKNLMSQSVAMPTIIFDEIDTGVSGEIADKMADIMEQMAQNMQVISITHLPQIAARGKKQYFVFKKDLDQQTLTQIKLLNQKDRIEEIARMLSGKNITPEAIENAKTLINNNE